MKVIADTLACKFCGSRHIVRYGHYKGFQRWWCEACRRKFADNDALPGMHTPREQVSSALGMYYEGMSQNAIRRQLEQEHQNYPSDSTVFEWIERFTKQAIADTKDVKPNVGDVWVADETVVKIGGKNMWYWDIIDAKTRYLLASRISTTRGIRDAQAIMELASKRADKAPKVVLTDKLTAYFDGIERAYGAETKHITVKGLTAKANTNLIERFHGTLKARTKVMRGMKSKESAQVILDGFLVHYNFFRIHESLGGKTPGEKAGIVLPYKNWADVTLKDIPKISETAELEPIRLREPRTKLFKVVRRRDNSFMRRSF